MKKQRSNYHKPFSNDILTGPLFTLIVLLLIEPLNHVFPYAGLNPTPFFLTMVVFSAFMGGTRSALISSVFGAAYCVQFYWLHGDLALLWEGEDLFSVVQLVISVLVISLLAGHLKENTLRPYRSALSSSERSLRVKTIDLMKSNSDLENFLHIASHDLKSPLFNLEGLMGILKDEVGPDANSEAGSVLRQMEKTMFSMHQTLHMLQAHMQSHTLQTNELTECNLAEILDEIRASISILISETGASIQTDFTEKTDVVFVRGKVHSILYNLLTNAIKYRDSSRKPVVRISAYKEEDYCVIAVEDNGLGIDLDKEGENLFRIFKRVHSHVEGTGVGLYLVKQIAESTGGRIEVKSTPGKGTKFMVYLRPAKVIAINEDNSAGQQDSAAAVAV